jgi:hypothetical protein
MRKLFAPVIIALLFLAAMPAKAQYVAIPDTNFRNWLVQNYPACMSGGMMDTTCSGIVGAGSMQISNTYIRNLEGVQYFDNLQSLFIGFGNQVDSIKAFPPNLTGIQLYCPKLRSIPPFPLGLESFVCTSDSLTFLPPLPPNLKALTAWCGQLTSLPALPNTLERLDVQNTNITVLPAVINTSLLYMDCSNNMLTALPPFPATIEELRCNNQPILYLPALPAALKILQCVYNALDSLPAIPPNLKSLYCSYNSIDNLPTLPDSLTLLECYDNQLTTLHLPPNLETLVASGNAIISVDTFNPKLTNANLKMNSLVTLPSFPLSLRSLDCTSNDLTGVPPLNAGLQILKIADNPIDTLPPLPSSLIILEAYACSLDSLPPLPAGILELNVGDNNLMSLPSLPSMLNVLNCSNNQITTIPYIPLSSIGMELSCENNQLTNITNLDRVISLNCSTNPQLYCLPNMPVLQALFFINTGISCLPSFGQIIQANPPLNVVSLCDIFNPHGCDVYWNISGEVYYDANTNCINDSSDVSNKNTTLHLRDTGGNVVQQYITSYGGLYSFDTDMGTYTLEPDTAGLPFYVLCPDSGYYTSNILPADSMDANLDFSFVCKPGFDIGVTTVANPTGIIRPANYAQVAIMAGDISNFYNAHCAAGVSGAVQVVINGPASYVSSNALPVSTVNADTLTWNIADFGTVNFNTDFNITIHTDTLAQIGQQVCFDVTVTPTVGDNNISNNTLTHCFDVVNSYDPNDKTAYPSGDIDTAQEWLNYTIRFQNTGNAPAQHIYVMDTLDSDVDASTFKLLAYSHDNITQVLPGGIIKFNFPNINLPDSFSNEPGSHGYIQYKIKLKDNLPLGTTISNTAFIYFDFNAPVETNTAVNTITDNVGIGTIKQVDLQMALIPNPAHNTVTIQLQNISPNTTLKVFDVLGTLVKQQTIQQASTTIDISTLQAGIYFVQVESVNGRGVKRLVVSR